MLTRRSERLAETMLEMVGDQSLGGAASGSAQGTVLIVTHGAGRGRRTDFLLGLLKRIADKRPRLSERVVAWLTGTPPPPLDEVRAIVFMLADPIEHFLRFARLKRAAWRAPPASAVSR